MATHADGMWAPASRGPTNDLRIKPELVAPASWLLSARSSRADFPETYGAWGWPERGDFSSRIDPYYHFLGGTSFAAPQVAGASLLVREFFLKDANYATPSAALVKATLVSFAKDMEPGQYYPSGTFRDVYNRPSAADQGWGRLALSPLLGSRTGQALWFDDTRSLSTVGGEFQQTFSIGASGGPLVIAVSWSDRFYDVINKGEGHTLVNDLDLEVTVVAGTTTVYRGNKMDLGWSVPNPTSWDRDNNLELFAIPSLSQAAIVTVKVRAWGLPEGGSQPFALLLTAADQALPTGTVSVNGGAVGTNTPAVTLGIAASDGIGVSQMRFRNEGSNSPITRTMTLESEHGLDWGPAVILDEPGNPSSFLRYIESDHPYANVQTTTSWLVRVPTEAPFNYPLAMRIRVGFSRVDLAPLDRLEVLDGSGNPVSVWTGAGGPLELQWSPEVSGDRLTVRLTTAGQGSSYGFHGRVYFFATEFAGCFAGDRTYWIRGNHRTQLHFDYTNPGFPGNIWITDSEGSQLNYQISTDPFWTPALYGDISVRIVPAICAPGYRLDGIRSFIGYERTQSRAYQVDEPTGQSLRIHFSKIRIHYSDAVQVTDQVGNIMANYDINQDDIWTITWPNVTRVVVRIISNGDYRTDWGFSIDKYEFTDYGWTPWERYSASKPWALVNQDGVRTVYAQLRDFAGNLRTVSDDIILDRGPPAQTTLTPPPLCFAMTADSTPTFSWSTFSDPPPTSGLKWFHFEVSADPGFATFSVHAHPTVTSYTTPSLPNGLHYVRVRAEDNAGNEALSWSSPLGCWVDIQTVNNGVLQGNVYDAMAPPGLVEGATVKVYRNGNLIATTTTDSVGFYQITGLPTQASLHVEVTKACYTWNPQDTEIPTGGVVTLNFYATWQCT